MSTDPDKFDAVFGNSKGPAKPASIKDRARSNQPFRDWHSHTVAGADRQKYALSLEARLKMLGFDRPTRIAMVEVAVQYMAEPPPNDYFTQKWWDEKHKLYDEGRENEGEPPSGFVSDLEDPYDTESEDDEGEEEERTTRHKVQADEEFPPQTGLVELMGGELGNKIHSLFPKGQMSVIVADFEKAKSLIAQCICNHVLLNYSDMRVEWCDVDQMGYQTWYERAQELGWLDTFIDRVHYCTALDDMKFDENTLVILDALDGAGCPSDGAKPTQFRNDVVVPINDSGATLIAIDHKAWTENRERKPLAGHHEKEGMVHGQIFEVVEVRGFIRGSDVGEAHLVRRKDTLSISGVANFEVAAIVKQTKGTLEIDAPRSQPKKASEAKDNRYLNYTENCKRVWGLLDAHPDGITKSEAKEAMKCRVNDKATYLAKMIKEGAVAASRQYLDGRKASGNTEIITRPKKGKSK